MKIKMQAVSSSIGYDGFYYRTTTASTDDLYIRGIKCRLAISAANKKLPAGIYFRSAAGLSVAFNHEVINGLVQLDKSRAIAKFGGEGLITLTEDTVSEAEVDLEEVKNLVPKLQMAVTEKLAQINASMVQVIDQKDCRSGDPIMDTDRLFKKMEEMRELAEVFINLKRMECMLG